MEIRKISAEETIDIRHRVLWPTRPVDFVRLDDDADGLHFGGFINGKLISVASIFIKDGSARLRKFATLEEYQGKGYGTKVLNYIIEDLKNEDVTHFWADARLSAEGFYNRFEMKISGKPFYKSDVKYIVMERNI